MSSSSSSKDKFHKKFINPDLMEVMKHPQPIETREWVLHISYVQRPKEGNEKPRLEVVEQEIFKCQGTMEFIHGHKLDIKILDNPYSGFMNG
ncbi:40S ribosomal protein S5-1 [Hordeum vulgare]|nr:40S ribosomal protein S5-1 [Hordeum vulgare]